MSKHLTREPAWIEPAARPYRARTGSPWWPRERPDERGAGLLWGAGRPILFLNALCGLAALALANVSPVLALVFVNAGLSAIAVFFWLARPATASAEG
jgi:hypothetical protein